METAHCWACNLLTTFDATKVPRANGQPLCARCVARINELFKETGQPPVIIEEGTYLDD